MCYLNCFQIREGVRCYCENNWNFYVLCRCHWCIIFSPRRFICWSSQHYSPCHQFFLYIFCGSLKEINLFFWWGDHGVPVDEEKVWNHVYWQSCTKTRAIYTGKVEFRLIFSLGCRYWKMTVSRRDNIGNWIWRSLYQVITSSFLMAVFQLLNCRRPRIMTQYCI